ncbi:MAG: DsbA family protein [Parvularcula sp.]|jgi:protein-disulfide isomerase|nr:DsbA family protein [Parvularcula sp.]
MTNSFKPLAFLSAALIALAACGGADEADTVAETETAAEAASEGPPEPEMLAAPEGSQAGGEMAVGSEDAPLTIVEYASVTCPGCAAFHAALFPEIREQFIDTGKVRFVYREFPTPPARRAQAGFILARCAATDAGPEAYFSMIDVLYKRQYEWVRGDAPTILRNIAAQAGIGDEGFDDCFRREDIRDAIISSIESGRDMGVTGTPTFFVDGERFELGGSVEETLQKIAAEVEKRS